ncbi:MAG: PilZ domain-containing protein [Candidatus Omnitrophica bacterium]|nr:PilZ domain-containing protein [Candidatus Omnitrophota bacterium]
MTDKRKNYLRRMFRWARRSAAFVRRALYPAPLALARPRFRFRVNQRAQLLRYGATTPLASRVEEVFEDAVAFAAPASQTPEPLWPVGTRVAVAIFEQTGIYRFSGAVTGRQLIQVPVLLVEKPARIVRSQRRQAVRRRHTLPVRYSLLQGRGASLTAAAFEREGWLRDISAQGMAVALPAPAPAAAQIAVQFSLTEAAAPVAAVVRISRVHADGFAARFIAGGPFSTLDTYDRRRIEQFVREAER